MRGSWCTKFILRALAPAIVLAPLMGSACSDTEVPKPKSVQLEAEKQPQVVRERQERKNLAQEEQDRLERERQAQAERFERQAERERGEREKQVQMDYDRLARARQAQEPELRARERQALMEQERLERERLMARAESNRPTQAERARLEQKRGITLASPVKKEARDRRLVLERYATVEAPHEVAPTTEFSLQVSLTEQLITPEVEAIHGSAKPKGPLALTFDPKTKSDPWQLDVVVSGSGFDFRDGINSASILLSRKGDSTPALFQLRARPIQGVEQGVPLYVTFWHRGTYMAKVVRNIRVTTTARYAEGDGQSSNPAGVPRL
jgi:hypothetical protein